MATWNPSDKSSIIALSGGDLIATETGGTLGGVRATDGISGSQKIFFKMTPGVSVINTRIGLSNTSWSVTTGTLLGNETGTNSIGYSDGGLVRQNGSTLSTIASFTTGDVISVAVDYANAKIWFKVNSGDWNNSATADPSTNTEGIAFTTNGTLYPTAQMGSTSPTMTADFTSSSGIPSGFSLFPTSIAVGLATETDTAYALLPSPYLVTTTGAGQITAPANCIGMIVEAWSGGQGGIAAQGNSGAGGDFGQKELACSPGNILYFRVGPGGASGGAWSTTNNNTWFNLGTNSISDANTWAPGLAGANTDTPASQSWDIYSNGGALTTAQGGGGARGGPGGGGAGGPSGAGTSGAQKGGANNQGGAGGDGNNGTATGVEDTVGASNINGGAGGAGGDSTVDGYTGGVPAGGGGGGGNSSSLGGAGGRGQLRVTFIFQNLTVGRANETDTAFRLGTGLGVNRANETNSAFALSRVLVRAVGLATEADTAFRLGLAHGIGRADETDTAFALSQGGFSAAAGLATETDTAFRLGLAHGTGRANETDTAFRLGLAQAVQRANETDTAYELLQGGSSLPVGTALEADTAFAPARLILIPVGGANKILNGGFDGNYLSDWVTFDCSKAAVNGRLLLTATTGGIQQQQARQNVTAIIGQYYHVVGSAFAGSQAGKIEADAGAAVGPVVNGTLDAELKATTTTLQVRCFISDGADLIIGDTSEFDNIAVYQVTTENDTAFALTAVVPLAAGLATETDTGFQLGLSHAPARADETDTAFALTPIAPLVVGRADETDTAFSLGYTIPLPVGMATETDFAVGFTPSIGHGFSLETDSAFALSYSLIRGVGLASETDTAFARSAGQIVPADLATETDTALALSQLLILNTARADETDTAFQLGQFIAFNVGMALETDTAYNLLGGLEALGENRQPVTLRRLLREKTQRVFDATLLP